MSALDTLAEMSARGDTSVSVFLLAGVGGSRDVIATAGQDVATSWTGSERVWSAAVDAARARLGIPAPPPPAPATKRKRGRK